MQASQEHRHAETAMRCGVLMAATAAAQPVRRRGTARRRLAFTMPPKQPSIARDGTGIRLAKAIVERQGEVAERVRADSPLSALRNLPQLREGSTCACIRTVPVSWCRSRIRWTRASSASFPTNRVLCMRRRH